MPLPNSMSVDKLFRPTGAAGCPVIVDMRLDDAFDRRCRDATGETHDWPTSKPKGRA